MKTTFDSKEIAHAWYHSTAPHGSCSAAMSFNGALFLSYATGIARKVAHGGKSAVILNQAGFSVSTSRHQGLVRNAIPGSVPVFYFNTSRNDNLNPTPLELFEFAVSESADCLAKAAKAKGRKELLEADAGRWLERAREVAAFYGLKRKVDEKTAARLMASRARDDKRRKKEEAARADKRRAEMAEKFEAWKAGSDTGWCNFSDFPVAFRVEDGELVSSHGARVPVREAAVALRFIESRRGQEWRENGETCPVGHYKIQSITPAGIVAGCHRITWAEIERVGPILATA